MTSLTFFVSATPYAFQHFLSPYIHAVADRGDRVVALSGRQIGSYAPSNKNIVVATIDVKRDPSPISDALSTYRMASRMRREQPATIYTISPKGGLVGLTAARLGCPTSRRTHFFTGQVWANKTGFRRALYRAADRVVGQLCHFAIVDSRSQADFLIAEGVLREAQVRILGSGSVSGIDPEVFAPSSEDRSATRSILGFGHDEFVVLFVGRLNVDKGLREAIAAIHQLAEIRPLVRLVIVGPDDGMKPELLREVEARGLRSTVTFVDEVENIASYYNAAEVLCLPSYREGFGTVVIEAAATGTPAIGSDIYGLRDAIVDGSTGLLFPMGDAEALATAILTLVDRPDRLRSFGESAKRRALAEFSRGRLVREFLSVHSGVADAAPDANKRKRTFWR